MISYNSTILHVHRPVSLKFLRFPDQHIKSIKRNIDTFNHKGSYTESHCPRNEPLTLLYTIFEMK